MDDFNALAHTQIYHAKQNPKKLAQWPQPIADLSQIHWSVAAKIMLDHKLVKTMHRCIKSKKPPNQKGHRQVVHYSTVILARRKHLPELVHEQKTTTMKWSVSGCQNTIRQTKLNEIQLFKKKLFFLSFSSSHFNRLTNCTIIYWITIHDVKQRAPKTWMSVSRLIFYSIRFYLNLTQIQNTPEKYPYQKAKKKKPGGTISIDLVIFVC